MAKNQGTSNVPRLPTPPSANDEAEAYIMKLEAEERIRQQREAADRARAEQEKTASIQKTADRTQQAYSTALNYGNNQLGILGIDDNYGILDAYRNELDLARGNVPEISDAPGSYLNAQSLWNTAYGGAKSRVRNQLTNQFDDFAGMGFDRNMIGDTMDDSIINSILGTQRDDALFALDTARARGKLNDGGYDRGLSELENMFKVGSARANDIGGGVLEGYRGQLRNRADNYRSQLQNFDFTSGFDLDRARNDLTSFGGSFGGRLEGDILSAIGDTNFFDAAKLIGKAGLRNGATNPQLAGQSGLGGTTSNGLDDRTLGSTGVF